MRFILMVVFASLLPSYGEAGRADRYNIVGFSSDRKVFVFEVYGDNDAAPGGRSSFYFIDLKSDTWLPGTPVAYALNDGDLDSDEIGLDEIRSRARSKAERLLKKHGPFDAGIVSAAQSLGQEGVDPYKLRWRDLYLGALPARSEQTDSLEISTFPLSGVGHCDDAGAVGLAISFNGKMISRDENLPASRGCPVGYFLEEVRSSFYYSPLGRVAIVAVFTPGFEGWDRGYITIPLSR